jgi:hypothetical protein
MRIITTISGREMTTGQLANALPDIAQATLYRQVNTLVEGDVLVVVNETQIRGTVEKRYALHIENMLNITEEDLQNAAPEDHVRYFTTFLMTLLGDYTRYMQSQTEVNLADDGIGYHTIPLHMTDEEVVDFGTQLQQVLSPYQASEPNRKRRLFSFVIMPSTDNDEKEE